jgi:hypothetical protein
VLNENYTDELLENHVALGPKARTRLDAAFFARLYQTKSTGQVSRLVSPEAFEFAVNYLATSTEIHAANVGLENGGKLVKVAQTLACSTIASSKVLDTHLFHFPCHVCR